MSTIAGSCLCGAVGFSYDTPVKVFQYCHCSRCRKNSGSAHAANIFVAAEQFRWTRGEAEVRRFELPTASWWCSSFCTVCGSSMPWLSKNGKSVIVPAGALDDDPDDRPARNVYYGSRAPWLPSSSELESFDTFPGDKS